MTERINNPSPVQQDQTRLRTQVSGKYSPDNPGVFAFKRQLVDAGVEVRFPVGDEIIEYSCDFAITVPHEATTPFHTTEVQFLREIKNNEFQVAYNLYGEREGYVGESTGVELAYALLRNKPTVLLRPPTEFSPKIARPIRALIEQYADAMLIEPLDRLETPDLKERVGQIALTEVDYNLSDGEKTTVMSEALDLTRKYRESWNQYTSQAHDLNAPAPTM